MPTLPRPIDSTLHGVTDYTVGTLLMTAFPKIAGIEGTESANQVRIAGAIPAGYSTLTEHPPGARGAPRRAVPVRARVAAHERPDRRRRLPRRRRGRAPGEHGGPAPQDL